MPMLIVGLLTLALGQAPALSGQVVDAEGRPAAGVEVLLSGTGIMQRPVLARATSDRDGMFRIEIPAEKDPKRILSLVAVWAYAPERGLAGYAFMATAIPASETVRLKLPGGPVHASFRVVGPDGKPVAGARVRPEMVRVPGGIQPTSTYPLPVPLADRLAATTDADGRGEIQGCRAADIHAVRVKVDGFGLQACDFGAGVDGVVTITLKAAGRLIGRVQADDQSSPKDLKVLVMTQPIGADRSQSSGLGQATTDADGRFEFALASGKLAINVFPPEGKKLRPELPSGLVIEPGHTTEVTIPLQGPAGCGP